MMDLGRMISGGGGGGGGVCVGVVVVGGREINLKYEPRRIPSYSSDVAVSFS